MDSLRLFVYNTMTRQKEEFVPLMDEKKSDHVLIYTCGPTVYGDPHIGNFRSWYFADTFKRTIKYVLWYPVKHTINITDVGHLTDDGDHGEDKMEKGSRKEWITAWDIASKYSDSFLQGMRAMGMEDADYYPKATDYIHDQIRVVQMMFQKWLTYVIPGDGIYCDTSKVSDYGKLLPPWHLSGLQEGARVDAEGKKHMTDFALRKFSPTDEKRQMERIFEGERMATLITDEVRTSLSDREKQTCGFPGWHVECSAMSWATLGKNIDIHTGGIDHIPVHHTNEIAQSECSFCVTKPWVRYWMHNQFLNIASEKISKSLGNVFGLADIRAQWFDPLDLRYFYHQAHYRNFQDFTWEALAAARSARYNLAKKLQSHDLPGTVKPKVVEIKSIYQLIDNDQTQVFVMKVLEALFDDINMPQVMALISSYSKQLSVGIVSVIYRLDLRVLGLGLFDVELNEERLLVEDIPEEVVRLAKERWNAKMSKNRDQADVLRQSLAEKGFGVKDTNDSYEIVKL